jgi:nicotinate-nucleotide adenylyltransferase
MCQLATENDSRIKVLDVEFNLPKPSYTVCTVEHLQKQHPDHYYFLCGADAFLSLEKWKDYQKLCQMVTFLVADRQGANEGALATQKEWVESQGGSVMFLPMEKVPLSSTALRTGLLQSPPEFSGVPKAVAEYIKHNKLYQE